MPTEDDMLINRTVVAVNKKVRKENYDIHNNRFLGKPPVALVVFSLVRFFRLFSFRHNVIASYPRH